MGFASIADIPAIAPPEGLQPNFENPKTLQTSLIAVNATLLPLMLMVVAARLYSRGHIMHAMGWDDYTCIMAALGSVAHSVMMLWDIHLGYGTHLWDIRGIELVPSRVRQMGSLAIIYPVVILCVKLSISLLYLRLFGVQRSFRYMVYAGIVFCAVFYTAYAGIQISTTVLCVDAASLSRPICAQIHVFVVTTGVVNVFTDLYLLGLPIRPVTQLKLKSRQKLGLLSIFMAGLVACSVSLARLIFASARLHDRDVLYNAALTSELTTVEMNVGIITASMPAMPQLFAKSKIFRSATYSSLRSSLFAKRNRSKPSAAGNWSGQSKASKPLRPKDTGTLENGYLELEDWSQFQFSFNGEKYHGGDDNSSRWMLKTGPDTRTTT